MNETETVKSQLETALSLFEDFSETLSRCEDRLLGLETSLNDLSKTGERDSPTKSLAGEASDLRGMIINLRQQVDKSITTDLDPLKSTLNYLHKEGIPDLTEQVKTLSIAVTALQGSMPVIRDSVNSVVANIAPMKADTEAAGKFARHFQEPLRELLGRTHDGTYDEGKFMLRTAAQVLFTLTGRDEAGKVEKGGNDRLTSFLDHYFDKNHLLKTGAKKESLFQFWDSFWDYCTSSIWHRVFDVIIAILIWLVVLNPAGQALKDAATKVGSTTTSSAPKAP